MATRRDILKLAADSNTDPGAVKRYLDGKPVRAATRAVVDASAERLGLTHLIPSVNATTRAA